MFGLLPTDADLLSAYLDNALPASERAALERRLTADPNLRTALDELQRTLVILRAAPQLAPPRDFTLDPARYGRSPATLRASRTNARVWLRWSAAIAAIALIALVGVIVRGINNSRQSTSSGAIAIVPTGMLLTSSTTPLTISTNSLAAKRTESPTLPTVIPSTVMSCPACCTRCLNFQSAACHAKYAAQRVTSHCRAADRRTIYQCTSDQSTAHASAARCRCCPARWTIRSSAIRWSAAVCTCYHVVCRHTTCRQTLRRHTVCHSEYGRRRKQ